MTHFQHLAKLQCKITTRILTLIQQSTEYFYHQKNLSCFILHFPPPRLPHSALVTMDLFSISSFFISRMLHKWNCTVCSPLETGIFTQHNSWDSSRLLHVSSTCSFLLMNSPWYKHASLCNHSLLEDICLFQFPAITNKAAVDI